MSVISPTKQKRRPNKQFQGRRSRFAAARPELRRWHSMKYIVGLLAGGLVGTAVAGQTLVVPSDVYELIKAEGCEQVSDFFAERPAVENPPYVVRHADGVKREAATWCTRDIAKEPHKRSYTLLLRFDDKEHPLSKCPAKIEGMRFIGGLSFIKVSEPAEWYVFHDTGKPIASKGKVESVAVSSIYDGTGDYFICVGNRWARRGLH